MFPEAEAERGREGRRVRMVMDGSQVSYTDTDTHTYRYTQRSTPHKSHVPTVSETIAVQDIPSSFERLQHYLNVAAPPFPILLPPHKREKERREGGGEARLQIARVARGKMDGMGGQGTWQ